MQTSNPITLTIVYDNNPFDSAPRSLRSGTSQGRPFEARLKTAWGFACLIQTSEITVLFDTGGDGPTLMDNLAALTFDPGEIDAVVLSHIHGDHTGGLDALLTANDRLTVYLPRSFPAEFKAHLRNRVVEVSESMAIADHIRTTGELGTAIVEQALMVETEQGLIVLTGCAHPGVVEIVRQAKAYGDVYLVMGGFHLTGKSVDEVGAVIAELKRLGVQKIAPCHCTGEPAIRLFEAEFGPNFIRAGVGLQLIVQE
jgi:7,8-dihydropterin-6-yl-methyl-4-(beta-D-ribofuranosyl)aminobenzene 5'-phosphate synthase